MPDGQPEFVSEKSRPPLSAAERGIPLGLEMIYEYLTRTLSQPTHMHPLQRWNRTFNFCKFLNAYLNSY